MKVGTTVGAARYDGRATAHEGFEIHSSEVAKVPRIRPALALLAAASLCSAACDVGRSVAPVPAEVAPVANTPPGAVRRLEWGVNHRDLEILAGLFSDDFAFQSPELDSAGNGARDTVATRDSVLMALRSLLAGASVHLSLDDNLVPFNDPRVGKNPKWHKTIRTSVDLVVVDHSFQHTFEATGHALFFLTRGDSAAIPADEIARGATADSTRWWIDRWEDETIGSGGARANPAARTSVWTILRFYRDRMRFQPLLAERHP